MARNLYACALASMLAVTAGSAQAATYHWFRAVPEREATSQAIVQLIGEYKKAHPGFDIQIDYAADRPSYLQKVKILATSGELPDLFDADAEPYFAEMAQNGMVANIGKIFDEVGITGKFYPLALNYEKLDDGSLYLIPWQSNTEYFWYHPSLFAKAKVEVPKTLEAFATTCKAISAAGITSIAITGKEYWPSMRYLSMPAFRLTGNAFLTQLRQGKTSMTSDVGMASTAFLQDVGQHCFQPGYTTADYTTALNLFTSGQAAIYYVGTWELPSMLDADGKLKPDIAYFKMPMVAGKNATGPDDFYAHAGIGTAIKAGSDTPEMKGFLRFFGDRFADIMLYDHKVLPSLKPDLRPGLPAIYKDILSDVEHVQTYAQVWDVKLDAATVDVLYRECQLLTLGQADPKQFATAIDDAIQQYNAGR